MKPDKKNTSSREILMAEIPRNDTKTENIAVNHIMKTFKAIEEMTGDAKA